MAIKKLFMILCVFLCAGAGCSSGTSDLPDDVSLDEFVEVEIAPDTGDPAETIDSPRDPDLPDLPDIEADDTQAEETVSPPCEFVRVEEGFFVDCSGRMRFIGVNCRGFIHYGYGDALPYSQSSDIGLNLSEAENMGVEVLRAFIPYSGIDSTEAGNRLQAALDASASHNIRLIAVLIDFYGATPYHPPGDDVYYETDSLGYVVLNNEFYASGYTNNYLPMVRAIVERFKDNPWVFAWELGNEIKNVPDPEVFITFTSAVTTQIRAIDENHIITAGLISTRSAAMNHDQAVRLHSFLDFITNHNYDGDDLENDSDLAAELGMPFIIEEAGFSGSDRPNRVRADMEKWFGRNSSGYMQWGFMATSYDNGDGDGNVGMDRVFHSDWDGLFNTYREMALSLTW